MNRVNFNQSVGFPLETETLDEMQKCWEILNAFGEIVSPLAIIKGCTATGANVSDGFVYINGELLKFVGGIAQPTVVIIEQPTSLEFEDGNYNEVYFNRYATFGATTTTYNWADFKRGMPTATIQQHLDTKANTTDLAAIFNRLDLLEAKSAVFQQGGGMVLWNKPANQIPPGWAEVVNWRGRLPIGQDTTQPEFATLGQTGGSKTAALTAANNGPHKHGGVPLMTAPGHPDAGALSCNFDLNTEGETELQGEGNPFSILNPYRVVLFIEWVGN